MIRTFNAALIVITIISFLWMSGCGEAVLDDYSDVEYRLVNQNGEPVTFPDDFKGAPLVLGFIYTNCPDICSFITSNIQKIHEELQNPGNVQFVLVTFDPARDTATALKDYAKAFDMDRPPFQFLTGDEETIQAFMKRVGVRTQESYSKELDNGDRMYFINHSDKILLIDQESKLIFDYGGSMTPPSIVIEDLEKL